MKRLSSYLGFLSVLFLICLLCYFNSLKAPFQFDGVEYIKENPYIIGLVDKKDYASYFWQYPPGNINNRPFLNYTFTLNYYLGRDRTLGYHLVNLGIHFAASLLVFLVLKKVLELLRFKGVPLRKTQANLPFCASLVFAVHPVQIQAVTYIMSRSASLCAFLYLASFYCFLQALARKTRAPSPLPAQTKLFVLGTIVLSLVLMRVAMGVKLIAVSLPAVILVFCAMFFVSWTHVAELVRRHKTGFAVTGVVLSALVLYKTLISPWKLLLINEAAASVYNRSQYFISQIKWGVFYYLKIWLFPFNLNIDPDVRLVASVSDLGFLSALLLLAALLFFFWKQSRLVTFGLLWIILTLAPESSFVPLMDLAAEHRLYLPGFGFALVLTGLAADNRRWAAFPIFLAVCLAAGVIHRNGDWLSEESLWKDATRKSPNKARAYSNYARTLAMQGKIDLARVNFQKSIQLDPYYFESHHNLALIFIKTGDCNRGIEEHKKALLLKPDIVESMIGIAQCYKTLGDFKQSIDYFKRALEIRPSSDFILQELGLLYYFNLNDKETGRFFFVQAVRMNPGNPNKAVMEKLIRE